MTFAGKLHSRLSTGYIDFLHVTVKVSVCIATYRRPERLRALLEDLVRQDLQPLDVVVVDNDASGSARTVVDAMRAQGCPFVLTYAIQPERSIPLTRNMTVSLAAGDWLAFVDDDERAPVAWLQQLMACASSQNADGVLAPVEPQVPESAAGWIRRGRFYDWPHLKTGELVPFSQLRFGNVLLRAAPVRELPGPFDPAFGVSTGEDGDMLMRFIERGAKVIWCDEALVWEPVEAKRLSLRWLLQRSFSGGQHYGRLVINGRFGQKGFAARAINFLRWSAQLLLALLLAGVSLPLGRHRSAAWLIKAWANVGKLTAFLGWRYGEYA
jgi:succinoglycan biosynthesis protein ExoM